MKIMRRAFLSLLCVALSAPLMRAQFVDSSSGLLQMPSAEMHADGVFSITNNYLNRHSLPTSGWSYDTFSYGFNLAFWDRFEVGYVLTIFDGRKGSSTTDRALILFNQDRHFIGKFQFLKEGEFGLK